MQNKLNVIRSSLEIFARQTLDDHSSPLQVMAPGHLADPLRCQHWCDGEFTEELECYYPEEKAQFLDGRRPLWGTSLFNVWDLLFEGLGAIESEEGHSVDVLSPPQVCHQSNNVIENDPHFLLSLPLLLQLSNGSPDQPLWHLAIMDKGQQLVHQIWFTILPCRL